MSSRIGVAGKAPPPAQQRQNAPAPSGVQQPPMRMQQQIPGTVPSSASAPPSAASMAASAAAAQRFTHPMHPMQPGAPGNLPRGPPPMGTFNPMSVLQQQSSQLPSSSQPIQQSQQRTVIGASSSSAANPQQRAMAPNSSMSPMRPMTSLFGMNAPQEGDMSSAGLDGDDFSSALASRLAGMELNYESREPLIDSWPPSLKLSELHQSSKDNTILSSMHSQNRLSALPGLEAFPSQQLSHSASSSASSSSSSSSPPLSAAQQLQQLMAAASAASGDSSKPSASSSSTPSASSPSAPSASSSSSSSSADRFGLMGLVNVIRMTDADLNVLTLGFDLTTLGLNLNTSDSLYSTFPGPFYEGPSRVQPEFRLPQCYFMQAPPLKAGHFSKFVLETLFYIFYSMPRDVLQAAAAQELHNRDWRYHKELKMWFQRVPGVEPTLKSATHERGSYVFFDVNVWRKVRKDNFLLVIADVEERRA